MTPVMAPLTWSLLIIALFSGQTEANNEVTMSADLPEEGPVIWKSTLTFTCHYTPGPRRVPDFLHNDQSLYQDARYKAQLNEPAADDRVTITYFDDEGIIVLTIKEITKEDLNTVGCSVSSVGTATPISFEVLEPPTAGVTNLAAAAEFTTVAVSFDVVEGATSYSVSISPDGGSEWETKETSIQFVDFEGLSVATDYEVKATASNAAGIRDEIEPAVASFRTKDNRSPLPVDGLAVAADYYDSTHLSLSWSLDSNKNEGISVTGVTLTYYEEGNEDAGITETYTPDVVSAEVSVAGAGDYKFVVLAINDFTNVETSKAMASHSVKPTTTPAPTTPVPTTPPKPTTAAPTEPPAAPLPLECDSGSDYKVLELTAGEKRVLSCTVPENAAYSVENIKWEYLQEEAVTLTSEEIDNDPDSFNVTILDQSSSIEIKSMDENKKGTYRCTESTHGSTCEYKIELTGADQEEESSASQLTSTILVAMAIVVLF